MPLNGKNQLLSVPFDKNMNMDTCPITLIDFEQDTDTEIELDVIDLCCNYSEWDNLEEYKKSYSSINSITDIEDATTYIPIPNTQRFITVNH